MDYKLYENLTSDKDGYLLDLHASANIGSEEGVRDIIENAENKDIINKQNKSKWTPLMYAASSTNLKVLLFLLEEGALPDIKNNFGQTALILASKCGSTDTVSMLIDFHANVNIKDIKGWPAVFYASSFGHRSVVQLLIEKGAFMDIIDKNTGLNPLMLSSAAGHEMIVRDLLQLGLNPAMQSKSGDTAKSLALKNGHHNVKRLIDAFDNMKTICTPLPANKTNCDFETGLFPLFQELQLTKYYYLFENQGIDLNTFWTLTDEDLKQIGINLFGPRKKMSLAIAKHHSSKDSTRDGILISENKSLHQKIEKLSVDLSREIEARKFSEKNLNDGVVTLRNFTENIQRTMRYTLTLGEKLRQSHVNLKKLLYCTPEISSEQFKRDIISPMMEGAERLMEEIQCQTLLSIQQTDFRY